MNWLLDPFGFRPPAPAADPSRLTAGEVELLLTAHGDCVSLIRVDVGFATFWRWAWREGEAA